MDVLKWSATERTCTHPMASSAQLPAQRLGCLHRVRIRIHWLQQQSQSDVAQRLSAPSPRIAFFSQCANCLPAPRAYFLPRQHDPASDNQEDHAYEQHQRPLHPPLLRAFHFQRCGQLLPNLPLRLHLVTGCLSRLGHIESQHHHDKDTSPGAEVGA